MDRQNFLLSLHSPGYVGVVLLAASLFVAQARAQKTTGGIEGTITDTTGAVVPHASVSATDETTGEKSVTTSDQTGFYHFVEVHPDLYLVVVEAPGFKQVSLSHVLVQISRVTSLNTTVTPGNTSEQVLVSSSSTDLDTVSTESAEVITAKQIEQLPIVGRAAMDLAQLSPGVQLRDGNDIDPTKNNFTIAAFQGRSGRETQIGRSLKGAKGLNSAITKYNSGFAGQPTPAGKLVVAQGLMSGSQLQQLSGVMPTLPLARPTRWVLICCC